MSSFATTFNEKILPVIMKFVSMKGVVALKDGILYTLPLTLVGSVFLLLAQLPYQPLNDWLAATLGAGWTDPLWKAFGATFNVIALIATIGIGYTYAKNEGHEPLSAGVISFVVFLLTTSSTVIAPKSGEVVGDVIPIAWAGGKGMVTAIIIGLVVGAVYSLFMSRNITIKMPAGVPQGVANSFAALIPAAVIILGATIVYSGFKWGLQTTLIEWIYKVLQTPLQGMTDSLGGVIVIGFLIPFLWWFGVHGASIVGGVMSGILASNTLDNQAIINSGKELTIANGAHIVTQQFVDQFMTVTGSGMTIGLVICMLFFSKSAQSKQLGRLSILPGIFNINEPVTFGTPIVMNPFMAVPFILTPVVSGLITYFAIGTGLVPPFSAVSVPWTTPAPISGLLVGGVRTALLQIVVLVISFFIYLPFFKKQDNINYKNEQEAQNS
ncbi:PTS sugar transporter subunit IIC [Clostridium saccharoperbutylacetonicum]|jgi:PTS system cellobiose-specific IIC component|uniref:Permease IIC component n=1 Tax=Clostridium saccharoperbutylacetonicum N1-4(HMT) TaxID=931276 RepID=M1N4S7_9CLOT|nr:PTS sugar transporter subunit IIC [Clostridium saccharoperbutylacetonicum]AGF58457.1 PTS system, lactose/cellobiose family IIC component [Clostridium saccharoperbutylacetonicum N1-4(HMT)]AQR97150.1 lichenan permease IIC component [Clostridium saccharoperbutylacetonicum]NRT60765.1 PTS system cellobiose-specific IIC component [Clostridium saccharoperbutylacetonicum]NSB24079.1 PTS system cellobiose-specific IIC component [Clostridium saccharoperbutylacetonicum]NSB33031.1 PTS system cellobiose-